MTLLPIGPQLGNRMRWCRRDPTITEILSDSIVKALMEADRIDSQALEAKLRSMAQQISTRRHPGCWVYGVQGQKTPDARSNL
jgi:hypothetical protein